MHYVENNFVTRTVGASAIGAGVAVKLVAGLLVPATAGTDLTIGTLEVAAAAGDPADVHVRSASGTINALAGGTIAVGDAVTATTGGSVITTTTAGNQILGYALEAATTGKFVELMPSTAKF